MVDCFLCLEPIRDLEEGLRVESIQWQERHIKDLIDRLWPVDTLTSQSWLCPSCLKELYSFQPFYVRIKELHDDFKSVVKMEPDPLEEESNPNDLPLETLLEPEISIDQTLDMDIVIKEEYEEPSIAHEDVLSDNDNEKFADNVDAFSNNDDGSDESESSDNDLAQTRRRKTRSLAKTRTRRNTNSDRDDSANSDTKVKQSNTSGKTPYHAKTNSSDHDKFLLEHFKIICNNCQQPFEKFGDLCKHYRSEHNERGFVICCQLKFFQRKSLVDHINYHLNPEYFKCVHCAKLFPKRRYLVVHLKSHEEFKHCCDVCDRKFVDKTKLDRHKLTHMPEEEKKFPCNECGKFFANDYVRNLHIRVTHLNVYAKICEICGQTMPDSNTFKLHMEKHDTTKPPPSFKCDECGLVLSGKRTLKQHKDLKHPVGGNRDYTCGICMKVSPNLKALKRHIQGMHELGFDYKCTVCDKAFKRPDNLKAHMSTHTGTPLYRCPWCPKGFNSNGNLHNHRKKAHPIEWEEARRNKYSGNLPPNCKLPTTSYSQHVPATLDNNPSI